MSIQLDNLTKRVTALYDRSLKSLPIDKDLDLLIVDPTEFTVVNPTREFQSGDWSHRAVAIVEVENEKFNLFVDYIADEKQLPGSKVKAVKDMTAFLSVRDYVTNDGNPAMGASLKFTIAA
jgi:hypothetical protein